MPPGSSIPTERNDGRREDDDTSADDAIDWEAESEPVNDDEPTLSGADTASPTDTGVDEPGAGQDTQPGAQGKPAAPKPPAQDTQSGAQGDDTASPQGDKGKQTPDQGEAPPKQETPEEKQAREQREQQARQQRQDQLAQFYALPEEMAARLATEPEKVLPVMAAQVHMAVEQGVQQTIAQVLPQMFQQWQVTQEANARSKSTFYERWPSLKNHEREVLQVGAMFRQMNPKATPQEALEKIGATVCAALGIQPDPKPGQGGGQPRTSAPARGQPRRPARPGGMGGSHQSAPPPSDNEFTAYAEQMLEDDAHPSG